MSGRRVAVQTGRVTAGGGGSGGTTCSGEGGPGAAGRGADRAGEGSRNRGRLPRPAGGGGQRGGGPELPEQRKLCKAAVGEFGGYLRANAASIPNYGERYRAGEVISSSLAESTINQVVSKRMVKKQQMRWTPRGAHLLLQVRTRVLNADLADQFRRWHPASPTASKARQLGSPLPRNLPRFAPLSHSVQTYARRSRPSAKRERRTASSRRPRPVARDVWWTAMRTRSGFLWRRALRGACVEPRPAAGATPGRER
jgi:hypothetical protein